MDFADNRYTLHEQLGKGSMGVVYRTFDRLTGTFVALKRIETDFALFEVNPAAANPRYQHMMLVHEFRMLAGLRHPNIISVLDYGFSAKGNPFFVMELLDNPATLLQAAQSTDSRGKVDLLIQILQALVYLHRHHILHRDLKPANVLVGTNGGVRVLDFGIAVERGQPQDRAGTVHYMTPEALLGQPTDETSDLYAVGVIGYEMFAGMRPFRGKEVQEIAHHALHDLPDPQPFYDLIAADPLVEGVAGVIFQLLEKDPEDRYSNALDAIRALCTAVGETLPPDEGAVRESFLQAAKFVGREQEMANLAEALKKAKESRGSAWLVGGESGVGKSRLLEEVRVHALSEGAVIVRGQFAEHSREQGWQEVVRHLALLVPISDAEAGVLTALVPDIDSVLNRPITPAQDFSTLAETVGQVISRVQKPTLLLLEDLQWADGFREVFHELRPMLGGLPILLIGSYRSDETPFFAQHFSNVNEIQLERLSYDDAAELSASMLGETGSDPAVLDLLYKETEGNAFFMVEVVRALAEEAGQLSDVGQYALPASVFTGGISNIVQRRLRRVPDWAYDGLRLAAVMGRRLNLPVLDYILTPMLRLVAGKDISVSISAVWREERPLNTNDWLLMCANAGILEMYDGEWRFTHDKLREQLLYELQDEQLRVLRSQAAKAVKALNPNQA